MQTVDDLLAALPSRRAVGSAHPAAKLTDESVRLIRLAHERGASSYALARHYGVSGPTVRSVIARKTWKHVA